MWGNRGEQMWPFTLHCCSNNSDLERNQCVNMCVCVWGRMVGWREVDVHLCTSGVLVLYVWIFVIMECVRVCVSFRVEKMKPFSDRGVTWLECKSGCGCLLFSISLNPDCLPEGLKRGCVLNAVWTDIGWLCLPCAGADASEAILFIY